MSQDMFASGKIIFFKFSKNRLNKEIREKIELISNHEADIMSVLEISEVKVITLRKELFSKLSFWPCGFYISFFSNRKRYSLRGAT